MSEQIAILFGPAGGNTEKVAKAIAGKLSCNNCTLLPVSKADEALIKNCDKIVFGISTIGTHTWADDQPISDWDVFLPKCRQIDFSGKKVAIFGLGDQIAYSNHFVDDMKIVYDLINKQGGIIVGLWPTEGYEFNDSEAVLDNKFVGLVIDEDRQSEMTEERIKKWINQIAKEW